MTNMKDGLGFEEVNQEVTSTEIISGNNIYGTTQVVSPTFSGTDFVNAEGELQSVSVSTTYGATIQAGSGETSAGSIIEVVYPTAYADAPIISVTHTGTLGSAFTVPIGSINAGSFLVEGGATETFNWIAVGI